MKIRSGFVSNSSSSSFILVFPYKPKSVEDIQQIVFPTSDGVQDPYPEIRTPCNISAADAANAIWTDIQKASKEQLVDEFAILIHYIFFDCPAWLARILEIPPSQESLDHEDHIRMVNRILGRRNGQEEYDPDHLILFSSPLAKKLFLLFRAQQENRWIAEEGTKARQRRMDLFTKTSKLNRQFARKCTEAFVKKHKDKHLYIVSFCDDTPFGCVMEHGNTFENIPHVRISHH